MSTASAEPEEPEHWASRTVSSILQTNFPGIASSLKPVLTSRKKSGLRQKGFARIPDRDEEVALPPEDATVAQEAVVHEVEDHEAEGREVQAPEAVAPDQAVAEVVPKAAAPAKDRVVAAETKVVEAGLNAKFRLNIRGFHGGKAVFVDLDFHPTVGHLPHDRLCRRPDSPFRLSPGGRCT